MPWTQVSHVLCEHINHYTTGSIHSQPRQLPYAFDTQELIIASMSPYPRALHGPYLNVGEVIVMKGM